MIKSSRDSVFFLFCFEIKLTTGLKTIFPITDGKDNLDVFT